MPLFDYSCDACGRVFESLVRSSELDTARPECPECGGSDTLRNTLAAFAVGGGGGGGGGPARQARPMPSMGGGGGGCGSCGDPRGPGACQVN